MRNLDNKARMETWSVQSPEEPGFHAVITPDTLLAYSAHIKTFIDKLC